MRKAHKERVDRYRKSEPTDQRTDEQIVQDVVEKMAREVIEFQSKCIESGGALMLKSDVARIILKHLPTAVVTEDKGAL